MAQDVSKQVNVQPQPTRSFAIVYALPLVFGVLLLLGSFLPHTDVPVENLAFPNLQIIAIALIVIGLALWTLYDVRGRFVSSFGSFVLGIVGLFTLLNFLGHLGTMTAAITPRVHVGIGFWLAAIGVLGLLVQLFLPRPVVSGVEIIGESGLKDFLGKLGVMGELLRFLWKRKLYWLIPMVLVLMVFIFIIVLGSSSAIAPFIYPLF